MIVFRLLFSFCGLKIQIFRTNRPQNYNMFFYLPNFCVIFLVAEKCEAWRVEFAISTISLSK